MPLAEMPITTSCGAGRRRRIARAPSSVIVFHAFFRAEHGGRPARHDRLRRSLVRCRTWRQLRRLEHAEAAAGAGTRRRSAVLRRDARGESRRPGRCAPFRAARRQARTIIDNHHFDHFAWRQRVDVASCGVRPLRSAAAAISNAWPSFDLNLKVIFSARFKRCSSTGLGTATPPNRWMQTECWDALVASEYLPKLNPRSQAILEGAARQQRHLQPLPRLRCTCSEAFDVRSRRARRAVRDARARRRRAGGRARAR